MIHLAHGLSYLDLEFQGVPGVIASAVAHGAGGVVLIDPGPTSCLDTLRARLTDSGIGLDDLRGIVLTHIHLDHAGATGTLVAERPALEVWVHEAGAPHLIDPTRLLESAGLLYGDHMERLWGEVRPVPADRVRALVGGERLGVAGRRLDVAYTPGHARHHLSFHDPDSGVAFVGDVAGIRRGAGAFVMPPTPPPDIDLEAWAGSLRLIEAWRPGTLFVTHFGPFSDVGRHVQLMADQIEANSRIVRTLLSGDGPDGEKARAFTAEMRRELRRVMTDDDAERYERAGSFDFNFRGLARYWRKKAS